MLTKTDICKKRVKLPEAVRMVDFNSALGTSDEKNDVAMSLYMEDNPWHDCVHCEADYCEALQVNYDVWKAGLLARAATAPHQLQED